MFDQHLRSRIAVTTRWVTTVSSVDRVTMETHTPAAALFVDVPCSWILTSRDFVVLS